MEKKTYFSESAGLLTTRGWGQSHYAAGTNRRAVEQTLLQFTCMSSSRWKDVGLPDLFVRRDVDRKPGGNPETYQNTCRSCHAIMDGLGGAFARMDFKNETLINYQGNSVAPKYNQNIHVYPEGYVTTDDSWTNQAIYNHNQDFGWQGPLQGQGLKAFGEMIASSEAFSRCWTERVFKLICKRDPLLSEKSKLEQITKSFEKSGYNLKKLFQTIAVETSCLGF